MSGGELNLDGIVGPTHNYSGLGVGNLASQRSRGVRSDPRGAALEGIAKMRLVVSLGVAQGVLPPHERPHLPTLRALGFGGSDAQVLGRAARRAPELLAACSSASAMWAANAATIGPSADSGDGRVHVTPANLASSLHRSIEAPTTARVLRAVLPEGERFVHHQPLPAIAALADEGAANHTRLTPRHGAPGLQLFVFGRAPEPGAPRPLRHPARQSAAAAAAVARLHELPEERVLMLQQSAAAIDAGAFHNDVIAVGDRDLLLAHERAFADGDAARERIAAAYRDACGGELRVVWVPERVLDLSRAVATYLFNSQLVTTGDGGRALIVPAECRADEAVWRLVRRWREDPGVPIDRVEVVDIRQSMRNGGGPACLRLRVVLTASERAALAPGVLLDGARLDALEGWVRRHYRDRLSPADLADPRLLDESRAALDELTGLLGLGPLYDFQGAPRSGAGPPGTSRACSRGDR